VAAAPRATVAVAFSGGRDSLALLHASCRSAAVLGLQVVALHVHHGLMPQADAWLAQAQRLCARWRRRGWPVSLRWARLAGQPAAGDSTEAWARAGRYAALAEMARQAGADLVLLAQHRRDQAETVLLQALRGGGPAGLASMPMLIVRDGLTWARPWLEQPRERVEAYVRQHRLKPIDDPSNHDPAFARSRLRRQVWPALQQAFGDAEQALAQVARRAQEADAVLAELAAADLSTLRDGPALRVPAWLLLSPARRANALRSWLRDDAAVRPTDALVQRLLAELPTTRAAQWPAGGLAGLQLYRGRLRVQLASPPAGPPQVRPPGPDDGDGNGDREQLHLPCPGRHRLPGWHGVLEVLAVTEHGVAAPLLASLRVAPRSGGERFALAPNGLPRSLKKQYQAVAVPAAQRDGPLLWAGDHLLFVPGLGLDARQWAPAGAPQWALRWWPGAAA
jgi:tRNA(Ile)-lysidine synthase